MARRIKYANFRGRRYIVRWRKMKGLGLCDPPDLPKKKITLNSNLKGKELLRVAVDEAIHACFWDLDNDMVGEASYAISDFLDRIGFKCIEE
jgi:hypothetical protein